MTNKEDENNSSCDHRIAALLAVHLVKQVLDEAHIIVNGDPEADLQWKSVNKTKAIKSCERNGHTQDLVSPADEKDLTNMLKNEIYNGTNVATSTPQKIKDVKTTPDNLIGQDDSGLCFMENQNETSTSLYINNLFDMTEVENAITSEDSPKIEPKDETDQKQLITEAMNNIMVSYVNTALSIAFMQDVLKTEPDVGNHSPITNRSSNSALADVGETDVYNAMGDVAFCVDNGVPSEVGNIEEFVVKADKISEQTLDTNVEQNKNDIARFENAYITLNRDFDQCSEGDGNIVQDPKGVLQEVELSPVQTSNKNSLEVISCEDKSELKAESAITTSAKSRKSTLAQRCRTQGSRLLACLRGWWRRKTPGKRKEARVPGSMRGLCPLSPDARRRAASLLDERRLGKSPTPSQQVVWKFNTVSEALVNSTRWNYTFELQHEGVN
ncbi:hypothetical protein ACJJTC_016157 [Scirpophaga incertulas]